MTSKINLNLYEGDGIPIDRRTPPIPLPDYTPLSGKDEPSSYIADEGLKKAVNIAIALGQPLLITGEPGTGKTQLAKSVAHELGLDDPLEFYSKTTSTASDLFYQYDALGRFHDAHLPDKDTLEPESYITYHALGLAILLAMKPSKSKPFLPKGLYLKSKGPRRSVVLIDEIDKAPRDLPNDLLNEVEKMSFAVKETGQNFEAEQKFRPILIITSNSEKHLPDAFLRRCLFYHIPFPDENQLKNIIHRRFPGEFLSDGSKDLFLNSATEHFMDIRKEALKKNRPLQSLSPGFGF